MICKVCLHCGLCPGDGKKSESLQVQLKKEILYDFKCDSNLPANSVGIAFDIGTTTVACRLACLSTGKEILSFGEINKQTELGSDVVSRISVALTETGFERLHSIIIEQLCAMIKKAMLLCQSDFSAARKGRPELKKIVIAGNTAMESFAAGLPVNSLAVFPFKAESSFGFEIPAEEIFKAADFDLSRCKIYFAPVVSAYVGGDLVCAMLASGFLAADEKTKFLADVGTNCEMCVRDGITKKITCTSTSAGPAFEGFGIECGGPAGEGSIVQVHIESKIENKIEGKMENKIESKIENKNKNKNERKIESKKAAEELSAGKENSGLNKNKKVSCKITGGGNAENISGTGLISAAAEFLKNKMITKEGCFCVPEENESCKKIFLTEKVYLTQKDIRNFQLAKGSVFCGLKILSEKIAPEAHKNAELFLAGGFGTKINIEEAVQVRMFPEELCSKVTAMGNASLSGAFMLLLDENLRTQAELLAKNCTALDLSAEKGFQEEFIKALDF